MADPSVAHKTAAGVEALIARLRDEGVAAGKAEAERLVQAAEAQALALVETAEAEARAKVKAAREEALAFRRAGEEALRIAARDTVLDLKEELTRRFADDVTKTVAEATRDEALLQRMILEVVGSVRGEARIDDADAVEVVLPRAAVGLDELRRKPEELREGSLSHFVAASAASMLRQGVTFHRGEGESGGLRVLLTDRGVSVDLTDRAVAEALLLHLQPRFRALLEGVVG